MSINQSTYQLMIRLWNHISRRGQFGLLLVLMVFPSFAEVVSIGAVLPFLGVPISPERIYNNPLAYSYIQKFGLTEPNQLLLPLTITFGLAAIFSGLSGYYYESALVYHLPQGRILVLVYIVEPFINHMLFIMRPIY